MKASIAVGSALLTWFATITAASACMNGVELERKYPALVRAAEGALHRGLAASAFNKAIYVLHHLATSEGTDDQDLRRRRYLARRAERIAALAIIRLDGRADLKRRRARRSAPRRTRRASLRWARNVLQNNYSRRPSDPTTIAHFAEGASRSMQALRLLRKLQRKDLMPDAWGYAALARLELIAGGGTAHAKALARCRHLAGRYQKRICSAPMPASRI